MVNWIVWAAILSVVLNLATTVWNIVMMLRNYRLSRILGGLCIDAFVCQNAPIWRAWSQIYGWQFKVNIIQRGEED